MNIDFLFKIITKFDKHFGIINFMNFMFYELFEFKGENVKYINKFDV